MPQATHDKPIQYSLFHDATTQLQAAPVGKEIKKIVKRKQAAQLKSQGMSNTRVLQQVRRQSLMVGVPVDVEAIKMTRKRPAPPTEAEDQPAASKRSRVSIDYIVTHNDENRITLKVAGSRKRSIENMDHVGEITPLKKLKSSGQCNIPQSDPNKIVLRPLRAKKRSFESLQEVTEVISSKRSRILFAK